MARKDALSHSVYVSVHFNSMIDGLGLSEVNLAYTAREICFSLRECSSSYNTPKLTTKIQKLVAKLLTRTLWVFVYLILMYFAPK